MKRRSGYGWLELIMGILLILLGIFTFIRPTETLTGVVIIYGIIAVLTGIADIVFYIKIDRHMGFVPTISLISGLLSVMAGVMLLAYPARAHGYCPCFSRYGLLRIAFPGCPI